MTSLHFRISPCFEYFNGPMVYWNGDVGICGCRDIDAKELIIGNLKNTSIKSIIEITITINFLFFFTITLTIDTK